MSCSFFPYPQSTTVISKDCCAEAWIRINYSFSDPTIWITWSWQTLTSNVLLYKAWEEDTYPCFRVKSLKCRIWGLSRRGVMNLRRLVMWTKSLKFSVKASLGRIALTPGWSVFLMPNTVKQMSVAKNFREAGSACSAGGLGNDLFRRNTSLFIA